MFVVQCAVVKGLGGITSAVGHYERMFREVGVGSAVLFSGPLSSSLLSEGAEIISAPRLLTSPISGLLPILGSLGKALLQRASGRPVVAIVHSDRALPALKRILPDARFVTPCHSDKFKHKKSADLVITLNAEQHAAARGALPKTRVAQLGNPYVGGPRPPIVEEGPPRLNFVARFTPTKDPLALLRAAAELAAPPRLRFFGDGELAPQVRAAAASSGLDVEFAGWHDAPFTLFHRGDILVLPSHWEGLPYLLQEALDFGVPIVASDVAGNRAALADGEFGLLFPLQREGALTLALTKALGDLDGLRVKAERGRANLRLRYGATAFWKAFSAELDRASEPDA